MRKYNFSSGPATLPEAVIRQAQQELLDWRGLGVSVMEISHRSSAFESMAAEAEADLRVLMDIPANYRVLFCHGGASHQFAAIPMNLLGRGNTACDYLNTGAWSEKAVAEAARYGQANDIKALDKSGAHRITDAAGWGLNPNAAYLHYTPNETIGGVEYAFIPESGNVPLVADMSSTILSRPLDVTRFGLIYAGAQKNIGPAGMTIVIVRDDLVGHAQPGTPTMLRYDTYAKHGSMYNTPPTFTWYLAGLVFKWLREQGGLVVMGEINRRKAEKLYGYIDGSGYYSNPIDAANRSWMNIPFRLADEALNDRFLSEAEDAGLTALGGHRSVGGMRASIYNAMPEAGVDALIAFMQDFVKRHG